MHTLHALWLGDYSWGHKFMDWLQLLTWPSLSYLSSVLFTGFGSDCYSSSLKLFSCIHVLLRKSTSPNKEVEVYQGSFLEEHGFRPNDQSSKWSVVVKQYWNNRFGALRQGSGVLCQDIRLLFTEVLWLVVFTLQGTWYVASLESIDSTWQSIHRKNIQQASELFQMFWESNYQTGASLCNSSYRLSLNGLLTSTRSYRTLQTTINLEEHKQAFLIAADNSQRLYMQTLQTCTGKCICAFQLVPWGRGDAFWCVKQW